ncbi:lanthionine synthetase LanC family protein [Labilibaculum sp. K2S]|uniref:lanthionine synthetase LanC family protein n=1 Tax=Labilibaculum sp. K2S TaxID=3056386 RepID=UPI0025A428A7|nr:lanthionine synthetase LanC family protein [Labilibaculum sp. K2S]MDM8160357.1 lanthionine synthetase LanC family protein [Labilibaculum sp. K2S]
MKHIISCKIELICEHLVLLNHEPADNSLHGGRIGNALFLLYASRYLKDKRIEVLGLNIVKDVIQHLQEEPMNLGFSEGLTGVLWSIKHLIRTNFLSTEYKNVYKGIEDEIYNLTLDFIDLNKLDLLHGALGNIYYLSYDLENNPENEKFINGIIQALKTKVYSYGGKMHWQDYNRDFFDFGVAHGICGLLLICNRLAGNLKYHDCLQSLISDITTLIMSDLGHKSLLDDIPIGINNEKNIYGSRYIWCNGSVGILYALSQTLITGNENKDVIQRLANIFSDVRDSKKHGIIDASLCHGTAGNMQISYRLFKKYGDIRFIKARDYWLQKMISEAKFVDGIAGFKTWNGFGMECDTSFLTGISGIGLAMLSYLDENLSVWDDAFLI